MQEESSANNELEAQQSSAVRSHTNLVLELTCATDDEDNHSSSSLQLEEAALSARGASSEMIDKKPSKAEDEKHRLSLNTDNHVSALKGTKTDYYQHHHTTAVAEEKSKHAHPSIKQTPGAVKIPGIFPSSEFCPDVSEDFQAEDSTSRQPNNSSLHKNEAPVTAVALEPGVLEEEIRNRLISETVQATSQAMDQRNPDHTPVWKRPVFCVSLGILIVVLLMASVSVGVAVLVKGNNSEKDERMPPPKDGTRPSEELTTLLEYLKAVSYDNGTSLEDTTSPQYQAYEWLGKDPSTNGGDGNILLRYALAVFYRSLGGNDWTNSRGWLSRDATCFWYSNHSEPCNGAGLVRISLRDNNLKGTIPIEIGYLEAHLLYLDLRGNKITGNIPSQAVSLLLKLEVLRLDDNGLTGSIEGDLEPLGHPEEGTGVTWSANPPKKSQGPPASNSVKGIRLKDLSLSNNRLTGPLPTWLGRLTSLQRLDLHANAFSGNLPTALAFLTQLKTLRVDDNELKGWIPRMLGEEPTELTEGRFEGNDFTDRVPSSLCRTEPLRLSADCEKLDCPCCTHCCTDSQCTATDGAMEDPPAR